MKEVENNMATETIDATKKAINHFDTLQRPDQTVSINMSKSGQFLLHVESKTKNVLISHGWKEQKISFNNPGTIDIALSDKESAETYVMYMTELDLDLFPDLMAEAFAITEMFLDGDYELLKPKILGLIAGRPCLRFNNEALHYTVASKSSRGHQKDAPHSQIK